MSGRRNRSLSALEVLARQVRMDKDLDAFPEVRRNLLTRIRGLQRLGLDQDDQDVAIGQVFDRRFLLLAVPTGKLSSPETMNTVIRTQEQIGKANSSRRRARRAVPWFGGRKRVPVPGRSIPIRETRPEDAEHDAGAEPEGTEDEAADAAGGNTT